MTAAELRVQQRVDELVEQAPPLTADQQDRLRVLLRSDTLEAAGVDVA